MFRVQTKRRGFTIVEVLVVIAIVGLILALLLPAVQNSRAAARRLQCLNNIRQIGLALQNYHDQHSVMPPFAVWAGPPGEPLAGGALPVGVVDRVALGLSPGSEPCRLHTNWLVLLLPFVEQSPLYQKYDSRVPVSAPENATVRGTPVSLFTCPDDPYNGSGHAYQRDYLAGTSDNKYARGNYGMNVGPDNGCIMGLQPDCKDGFTVDDPDLANKNLTMIGSGVGGFNVSIKFSDVTTGLSNMVAIDELRAGIHPADPRGSWALGFIGASGTMRHGMVNFPRNDGGGPNNSLEDSDDIVGCTAVETALVLCHS